MNILFLTISSLPHLSSHSISLDLLREFKKNGHNVYVVGAIERGESTDTNLTEEEGCKVLRVKIGKNKKANLIEKGLTTVFLPLIYKNAVKKYFSDVKFDLVLYPTPPVTHVGTVSYIKKRDNAKAYLLLKDIFPQNAADLGMMSKSSPVYKYFRYQEKRLYKTSDYIGCMSQANVDFVKKHNPYVKPEIVHICPNAIEVLEKEKNPEKKLQIRKKHNIPEDATVFVYGGNLGKPQGIPFIIDCLKANSDKADRFFLICGKGTEYKKLESYVNSEKPKNVLLMQSLPKEEYEELVTACDVGLIFLDKRFTIPNFPSRLLSYMQNGMPVISCTDKNTDIGKVIEEGGFGWHTISDNTDEFTKAVDKACTSPLNEMGEKALSVLKRDYTSERCYNIIMENLK